METGACTPHKQQRRACRERERKRLPTALSEHTTSSACVRQQHPGVESPVVTRHGRPARRDLSGFLDQPCGTTLLLGHR